MADAGSKHWKWTKDGYWQMKMRNNWNYEQLLHDFKVNNENNFIGGTAILSAQSQVLTLVYIRQWS